ncbi:putative non-specific serine/threonine protein kinase [Helianthus anomalus]
MGNVSVRSCDSKDGFFQSKSYRYWCSRSSDLICYKNKEFNKDHKSPVQNTPPRLEIIAKNYTKLSSQTIVDNQEAYQDSKLLQHAKKPYNVKRILSARLQADSVLKTKTGHLKEYYNLGPKLGHGQFGTTYLCIEKTTGKRFVCKSIGNYSPKKI